jgi:speckle-type POZ protein
MAASQSPIVRVPSRCTPETARATVAFEVIGYSLHKGLGRAKYLSSEAFSVGGYEWCIRYYPDGYREKGPEDYVSVSLRLLTKNAEVRALYTFKLVDPVTGQSHVVRCPGLPQLFDNTNAWGCLLFMKRTVEQESKYLRDDRLLIECDLEVIKEKQLPPSDLSENLAKLFAEKKGADVTFSVQGEVFPAHRVVLAMRSPVFDADLDGPMGDNGRQEITIEDMQPTVFKAFLHFIYTDSMPSMDDLADDDKTEMVKHLLVAADKYALERMKMICEGILCKSLDVETVATILALADQHHCSNLKDACIEFMLSSNRIDDVVASQGYVHLKRSCPDVIVDVFERAAKSRKI